MDEWDEVRKLSEGRPPRTPSERAEAVARAEQLSETMDAVDRLYEFAAVAGQETQGVYNRWIAAGRPALDSGHPFWVELENAPRKS